MKTLPTVSSRPRSGVSLLLAGAGLLALALTSFGLSCLALGALALPIALGIAAAKAGIVLVVFMDFAEQSASVKLAALAALLMVVLLAGLMAADGATREPSPLISPSGGQ
jgi:cytochrome c oxidase subunit IV